MALTSSVTVRHVELDLQTGDVFVAMMKQVLRDDGSVVIQEPHRVSFHNFAEVDEHIEMYDKALVAMGYVPATGWEQVREAIALARSTDSARASIAVRLAEFEEKARALAAAQAEEQQALKP